MIDLVAEARVLFGHIPHGEMADDEPIEFQQDRDGHVCVRRFVGDVEDVFYLRGLGDPEGPAVYRVRSWLVDVPGGRTDTGRRVTIAWRDGVELGSAMTRTSTRT